MLVISEDDEFRLRICRLLVDKGFETRNDEPSVNPLQIVEAEFSDIILLDASTPNCSAIETCRTIKENKSTENLPVLMLIAAGDDEHIHQACEAGADSFLTKPLDPQKLLIRIIQQLCVTPEALVQKEDYGFPVA
ncbi:hypothetical protein BVY04_01250 [bacterium M21]|nr:hypothetical protein BVY04_01250 [bacterium M21]